MDSNSASIDVRAALLFRPGTDLHLHHAPDERGFRVSVQVSLRIRVFAHRQADDTMFWIVFDIGLKTLASMYLAKPGAARRVRSEVHVGNTWGEGYIHKVSGSSLHLLRLTFDRHPIRLPLFDHE